MVIRRSTSDRAIGTICRQRAVDDLRVSSLQRVDAKSEPFGDAWAVVLDEHVGIVYQVQYRCEVGGVLQVGFDELLVTVLHAEQRTKALCS